MPKKGSKKDPSELSWRPNTIHQRKYVTKQLANPTSAKKFRKCHAASKRKTYAKTKAAQTATDKARQLKTINATPTKNHIPKTWTLTLKEAARRVGLACYLCGYIPTKGAWCGLDQVIAGKGYTPTNAAPCCGRCNAAKGTTPLDEFLAMMQLWAGRSMETTKAYLKTLGIKV